MEFSFTDEQWDVIGDLVVKIGGEPVVWLRGDLEQGITRYFVHGGLDKKIVAALKRVNVAANEMANALEGLVYLSRLEAEQNNYFAEYIIKNDVNGRVKFGSELRQYASSIEQALNGGYKEIVNQKISRGRPCDEALVSWSQSILTIAEQSNWEAIDVNGRTSRKFIDLQLKIAEYASFAGFNHYRVVRRALVGAVDKARRRIEEEKAERRRAMPLLAAGAVDIVPFDHLNREAEVFFLRRVEPKSD